MAIFSDKIISSKFIDPPNNMLIELLYREDDAIIPYIIEVDFTSKDFNDLLLEVTLEEIENNTVRELKVEKKAFDSIIENEVDRRWEKEQEKVKAAYNEAEAYAQKVIEQEYDNINAQWKKLEKANEEQWKKLEKANEEINTEYGKIEKASIEINAEYEKLNNEYEKLSKASIEINAEYDKLEKAAEEINAEYQKVSKASVEINTGYKKLEEASIEINTEYQKLEKASIEINTEYQRLDKEYEKVNVYAELEKSKKFQEVQEEFQKAREELQLKFTTQSFSMGEITGKEVFSAIDENNQDDDFVFNLKVSILEDPIIAKSRDKKLKLAIRKSKSVLELLKIYAEAKEAA